MSQDCSVIKMTGSGMNDRDLISGKYTIFLFTTIYSPSCLTCNISSFSGVKCLEHKHYHWYVSSVYVSSTWSLISTLPYTFIMLYIGRGNTWCLSCCCIVLVMFMEVANELPLWMTEHNWTSQLQEFNSGEVGAKVFDCRPTCFR